MNQNNMIWARVICPGVALIILASGCATPDIPPKAYFHDDDRGRYYETKTGRFLRVDGKGTVYDVTCPELQITMAGVSKPLVPRSDPPWMPPCPEGWLVRLGEVRKLEGDWDMTGYNIAAETGTCKPLLTLTAGGRVSCWNRAWEIPVIILTAGLALLALAGLGSV